MKTHPCSLPSGLLTGSYTDNNEIQARCHDFFLKNKLFILKISHPQLPTQQYMVAGVNLPHVSVVSVQVLSGFRCTSGEKEQASNKM